MYKLVFLPILLFAAQVRGEIETSFSTLESVKVYSGKGRINSIEAPIYAFQDFPDFDFLKDQLKKNLRGKATLTEEQFGPLRVLVIANIRSKQCPRCTVANPANLERIVGNAYTISVLDLGSQKSPVAIAAPTGVFLKSVTSPQTYSGKILREATESLTVDSQLEFLFNKSYTHQVNGTLNRPFSEALAVVEADIRRLGYKTHAPNSNLASENSPKMMPGSKSHNSLWENGSSSVYVELSALNQEKTRINFYEIITR